MVLFVVAHTLQKTKGHTHEEFSQVVADCKIDKDI